MDLVPEAQRALVFAEREAELKRRAIPLDVTCFGTSIWDESLYRAWSAMVVALIPNVSTLQSHLDGFARVLDADEVVLFERATFLVIAHTCLDDKVWGLCPAVVRCIIIIIIKNIFFLRFNIIRWHGTRTGSRRSATSSNSLN